MRYQGDDVGHIGALLCHVLQLASHKCTLAGTIMLLPIPARKMSGGQLVCSKELPEYASELKGFLRQPR